MTGPYCEEGQMDWLTIAVFVLMVQQIYFTVAPADILDICYGDFHLIDSSSLHVPGLTYTAIKHFLEPGYLPWLNLAMNC